jgi:hypothetical protein
MAKATQIKNLEEWERDQGFLPYKTTQVFEYEKIWVQSPLITSLNSLTLHMRGWRLGSSMKELIRGMNLTCVSSDDMFN